MGCSSSSATAVSGFRDDPAFTSEAEQKRRIYDKKKGYAVMNGEDNVPDHEEQFEEDPVFEE